MKKVGRPKKNGEQPMWTVARITLAVLGYDQARKAGQKHAAAITDAVRFVRVTRPEMKISETEVRRILASWRPKDSPDGLLITKPDPADCMVTLPNGRVVKRLWDAGFGPRPVYDRANAAKRDTKSSTRMHFATTSS